MKENLCRRNRPKSVEGKLKAFERYYPEGKQIETVLYERHR